MNLVEEADRYKINDQHLGKKKSTLIIRKKVSFYLQKTVKQFDEELPDLVCIPNKPCKNKQKLWFLI